MLDISQARVGKLTTEPASHNKKFNKKQNKYTVKPE
jgi:hypothetical protein